LEVHILTADTFGSLKEQVAAFPVKVMIIPRGDEAQSKASYVRQLGAEQTAAIGNGRNDRLMIREAALGVAVVQGEGAAVEAITAADVVTLDIMAALDLFIRPHRLTATLPS